MVHVYASVEESNSSQACKEMVFSFFLHVIGKHEWESKKFNQLIPIGQNTIIGCKFLNDSAFTQLNECAHEIDNFESRHDVVDPNSNAYQKLLEIVSKNQFIDDLCISSMATSHPLSKAFIPYVCIIVQSESTSR